MRQLLYWATVAVMVWTAYILTDCAAVKTSCAVIDLVHETCDLVTIQVREPDGTTASVQVPRTELTAIGLRYAHPAADGGSHD